MAQAQAYDPTNPTPYQAVEMPQPTPAAPSPLPTQMPEANGAVKHSGAIATIADGILRGFMQGRAYGQARQVMQLKSKVDNLQNSYNQDAQLLHQMTVAGVDPNSQEYKQAVSSVQGSWGALMDFYGQHLEQQPSGKKKNKVQQAGSDILSALHSPDPAAQSSAWYQVAKKAGPPIFGQIATLNTPAAQAARQAQQAAAQNANTAQGIQGQQLTHEQVVTDAQAQIDKLNKIPRAQWTQMQRDQYDQLAQVVTPVQAEVPGDEAKLAADALIRKKIDNPDYQFTEGDKQIFRAAHIDIDPKAKLVVTKTGEIVQENSDGTYEILRGNQPAYEPHGRGGAGGSPADKNYAKWDAYYKEHYPNLDDDERKSLVERKVEGASQHAEGSLQSDAIAEPRKFDNEVLTAAIGKLQSLPEYKTLPNFDDLVSNLVGQDADGYAYNTKMPKPRADGMYSGQDAKTGANKTADFQKMDRDLQQQIMAVLNDPKNGLSQNEKRAAMARMRPLFGPAAQPKGSGNSSVPPPTPAAPPAAPASSPAPNGAQKPSKGTVRKKAFLQANPGATEADWDAVKPQLQQQGYDTKDE